MQRRGRRRRRRRAAVAAVGVAVLAVAAVRLIDIIRPEGPEPGDPRTAGVVAPPPVGVITVSCSDHDVCLIKPTSRSALFVSEDVLYTSPTGRHVAYVVGRLIPEHSALEEQLRLAAVTGPLLAHGRGRLLAEEMSDVGLGMRFQPVWDAAGTELAYTVLRDDGPAVMAAHVDGSTRVVVRGDPSAVAWMPDGRLAYCDGDHHECQWKAGPDGAHVAALSAPNIGEAAWAPDGSKVAYAQYDGPHSTIWIADADGRNRRPLVPHLPGSELVDRGINWSPDSQYVAFGRVRDPHFHVLLGSYIVRVDGTGLTKLTSGWIRDWLPTDAVSDDAAAP